MGSQRVEYYFMTIPPPDVVTLHSPVNSRSKDKKERGGGRGRMEADRNDAMTSHGPPWRLRELEEINLPEMRRGHGPGLQNCERIRF